MTASITTSTSDTRRLISPQRAERAECLCAPFEQRKKNSKLKRNSAEGATLLWIRGEKHSHHCGCLETAPEGWGKHGPPWWRAPAFEAAPPPWQPGRVLQERWPDDEPERLSELTVALKVFGRNDKLYVHFCGTWWKTAPCKTDACTRWRCWSSAGTW